jgi:hypothetical protein
MIWRGIVVPVTSAMRLSSRSRRFRPCAAIAAGRGRSARPAAAAAARLLEMLFGPRILQPPRRRNPGRAAAPAAQQQPQQQRTRRRNRRCSRRGGGEESERQDHPGSRRFRRGGLAWGLEQTFAEEPMLTVVEQTSGSSGLVRDDYYDWNGELLNILNERKPDIVVVALGSNDRQQIRVDARAAGAALGGLGEGLHRAHRAMADTLKVYGRPFFWMGAPPMRQNSAMRDMAYASTISTSRRSRRGRGTSSTSGAASPTRTGATSRRARMSPASSAAARRRRHQLHPRRAAEACLLRRARDQATDRHRHRRGRSPRLDRPAKPDRNRPGRRQAAGRAGDLAVGSAARREPRSRRRAGRRAAPSPARRRRRNT